MRFDELVQKYIELRDKKAEMDAAHKAKVAKITDVMDKIEQKMLEVFNNTGMDSIKTEFGTAYRAELTTASVADREVFMRYVQEHNAWPLLEVRCSKSAVEEYQAANDELPPGINWKVAYKANFRRS